MPSDFRSDRDENVDQPERDDRKHWRPYLEYLQHYGARKRAEGNPSPDDVHDQQYLGRMAQEQSNAGR
jgi:hypothetical protein